MSPAEMASQGAFRMVAFGEYADDNMASAMKARDFKDATDLVVAAATVPCLRTNHYNNSDATMEAQMLVTHVSQQPIAFNCKQDGADAGEVAPTLRAMGHDNSHANGGGQVAVAFPVCYRVHGEHSSAMTSKNSTANVADAVDVARCLDTSGGFATNQGGNVVLDAKAVDFRHGMIGDVTHPLQAKGQGGYSLNCTPGVMVPKKSGGVCPNSSEAALPPVNPTPLALVERTRDGVKQLEYRDDTVYCLTNPGNGGRSDSRMIFDAYMAVRRLMPVECERLMCFPDNYTRIPWKGKPAEACPDSPRYKALGNSMVTYVMFWLGYRIDIVLRVFTGAWV